MLGAEHRSSHGRGASGERASPVATLSATACLNVRTGMICVLRNGDYVCHMSAEFVFVCGDSYS